MKNGTVVVTGSSAGLSRTVAHEFGMHGARVTLLGPRQIWCADLHGAARRSGRSHDRHLENCKDRPWTATRTTKFQAELLNQQRLVVWNLAPYGFFAPSVRRKGLEQ